jgi:AraC-like DNA-binding protein
MGTIRQSAAYRKNMAEIITEPIISAAMEIQIARTSHFRASVFFRAFGAKPITLRSD